jgi:hypothetical protein
MADGSQSVVSNDVENECANSCTGLTSPEVGGIFQFRVLAAAAAALQHTTQYKRDLHHDDDDGY